MKLDALLSVLQAESLLTKEARAEIRLEDVPKETPLSVQVLAGVGAWAASCGFLSLLVGLGTLLGIGEATFLLPIGVFLGGASVVLCRWSEGLLARQLAMAWAMGALTAIGTGAGLELEGSTQTFVQVGLGGLLVLLHREVLIRFLAVLFCLSTLVWGAWEREGLGIGNVGALAGGSVLLFAILWPERLPPRWTPARGPLLWASFLFLAFGAGGVSLARDYLPHQLWPQFVGPMVAIAAIGRELHRRGVLLSELGLVAGMGTVGIAALTWGNPGVCLGMAGLVVAYSRREKAAFGLAVVVLVGFGIRYYYQLNLDLYTKAGVLAASGAVLLGLRLYLRARGFLSGGEVAAGVAGLTSSGQRWGTVGVLVTWLVAFFLLYNPMILAKEDLLRTAPRILLELAGRDPRSLMSGDYLRLEYAVASQLRGNRPGLWDLLFRGGRGGRPDQTKDWDWEGVMVLRREPPDPVLQEFINEAEGAPAVATFVRLDDGSPLTPDELRIRYHRGFNSLWIGTDAFYIQEGSGERYAEATYAELAVAPDGESVLIGLRGLSKQVIGERLVP